MRSPRYGFRVPDPQLATWLEQRGSVTKTTTEALELLWLMERHGYENPHAELGILVRQVQGIGTNLNQLTHVANSSKTTADWPGIATIEGLATEIRAILPDLRAIVRAYR